MGRVTRLVALEVLNKIIHLKNFPLIICHATGLVLMLTAVGNLIHVTNFGEHVIDRTQSFLLFGVETVHFCV